MMLEKPPGDLKDRRQKPPPDEHNKVVLAILAVLAVLLLVWTAAVLGLIPGIKD